jgi:chaperonin GroEL (HSP60 family)
MAQAIDAEVPSTAGKRALAMEAYARALRQLPTIIADNGGYDSSELVTQVRTVALLSILLHDIQLLSGGCWCQRVRERSRESRLLVVLLDSDTLVSYTCSYEGAMRDYL